MSLPILVSQDLWQEFDNAWKEHMASTEPIGDVRSVAPVLGEGSGATGTGAPDPGPSEKESMTDSELLEEFVRVERTDTEVRILVHEIRWDGPHTPIHTWEIAKCLPATASKAMIDRVVADLLRDDEYFRVCPECAARKPFGWNDGSVCQQCAQEHHGVVY